MALPMGEHKDASLVTPVIYHEFGKEMLRRFLLDPEYQFADRRLGVLLMSPAYPPDATDGYRDIPRTMIVARKTVPLRCRNYDLFGTHDLRFQLKRFAWVAGYILYFVPIGHLIAYHRLPDALGGNRFTIKFSHPEPVLNTSHAREDALCFRALLAEGALESLLSKEPS
jgi:hypothetical protein